MSAKDYTPQTLYRWVVDFIKEGSTMEDYEVDYKLSKRTEWTLRLLSTPNEGGVVEPMFGRTRMVKAMFLVQRKLQEVFDEDAGFDFRAYKYGPFDEGVYEALEDLERKRLITITPPEKHRHRRDEKKYELTEKGQDFGDTLLADIGQDKRDLLSWVKNEQASRPLGSLLSYVYNRYPDMTTNSEIKDRVQ